MAVAVVPKSPSDQVGHGEMQKPEARLIGANQREE
jgi:hypothetical protein